MIKRANLSITDAISLQRIATELTRGSLRSRPAAIVSRATPYQAATPSLSSVAYCAVTIRGAHQLPTYKQVQTASVHRAHKSRGQTQTGRSVGVVI
jgi:hypothetical protein